MFFHLPVIIKKIFTYGFFNGINALFPFFLLPILTRYLNPEEYGIITLFNIIVLFIGVFFRLELQAVLKREYIEEKDDFSLKVNNIIVITLINFIFSLIILTLFSTQITRASHISLFWLYGMLIVSLGGALTTFVNALYQIKDEAFRAGVWGLINTIPVFLGAFVMIVFFAYSWQGRIWPMILTAIFIQIPLSLYLIKKIVPCKLKFEIHHTVDLLKYSLPLVPITIITYIMQVGDRMFIAKMIGLEAAGLYSVSAQLATIISTAYSSFLPTWEVFVFRQLNENTKRSLDKLKLYFMLYLISMIILALITIFICPYLMFYLLGKSFLGSVKYLSWIIFGVAASGIFYALHSVIYYLKKTKILMYTNFLLVVLYLVLNYILISVNGAVGAAQSAFVIYIIGSGILLYVINQNYKHFIKR